MSKKTIRIVWVLIILISAIYFFFNQHILDENSIKEFISKYKTYGLGILLLLHVIRGFLLFPAMPLIVMGGLLYPSSSFLVLIISLVGIAISSSMIYFLSEELNFKDSFDQDSKIYIKIKTLLSSKFGFLYILVWAFIPVVPTDLVSFIAGTMTINYWKYIAALMLGALILCVFTIYGSGFLVLEYF